MIIYSVLRGHWTLYAGHRTETSTLLQVHYLIKAGVISVENVRWTQKRDKYIIVLQDSAGALFNQGQDTAGVTV